LWRIGACEAQPAIDAMSTASAAATTVRATARLIAEAL
jgi:hypothetical protein